MAASTLVSLEQYLATTYSPDMEYIGGELKEASVVMTAHGALLSLLSQWFANHGREWGIRVAVEARTQVSPDNVRLPDVVVGPRGRWPQVLLKPPLIVIEILSPSDSAQELVEKIGDYLRMGIPNIWIINSDERSGFAVRPDAPARLVSRLEVPNSPIYVDLPELFARLDEDEQEAR